MALPPCRLAKSSLPSAHPPTHHPSVSLPPYPTRPQMTDVLRRYPDAAEACVESIAAIPEDVSRRRGGEGRRLVGKPGQ